MAASPSDPVRPERRAHRRLLFRSPSPLLSLVYLTALSAALAALYRSPVTDPAGWGLAFLALFLGPGLLAGLVTPAVAGAFGGRFSARRSVLLALSGLVLEAPVLGVARLWNVELPGHPVSMALILLLAQGPVLWFRHLSLYGVSNPSHARSLPASLVQPLLGIVGYTFLFAWTLPAVVAAGLFLALGFLTVSMLLRASDRPLRREFQVSGVGLIRPILDHIGARDPAATEALESFFRRFAITADLSAALIEFRSGPTVRATLALPTVHPGPFAALGSSDLPRKVADRLGRSGGTVLVPHTPCNHELDIPTTAEVERVLDAISSLRSSLRPAIARAGPLVEPRPGSLARAQQLGDTTLVLVSQAPEPTDDIAFAVGDTIRRRHGPGADGAIALIDAHNSYVEDRGDIAYGTPVARQLAEDVEAAIRLARASAVEGAPRVGVASRLDLTVGVHGIGPAGIRALVIEAAGRRAAYVLIDGNNLVQGARASILAALSGIVEDAEVLTTDNHIVHEVDGSTNPVGGRYPATALARDCRALVEAAVRDLTPVEVRSGEVEIPGVSVLGPSWTERLLTSLGDTVSVFAHLAAATLLLLLVSSLVVLVGLS